MKTLDTRTPLKPSQVARIVGVTARLVNKWIADGDLKGYLLPGGHQRTTHANLRAFLKKNNMPTDRLDAFEEGGWAAIEDEQSGSD